MNCPPPWRLHYYRARSAHSGISDSIATIRRVVIALSLCLVVANPYASRAQSRLPNQGRKRFVKWIYQDAASVLDRTYPYAPVYAAGGLTAFGTLSFLDRWAADELPEGYSGFLKSYTDITNNIGGPLANIPVVGVFAISLVTSNDRFQDASFTSLEAVLYSGAVNYGLKYFFGRVRPEDTDNPLIFALFSGNSSFPSGHANAAFAILTPWVMYYPHPITYALLVVGAGGTAVSRIAREKHWASDVLIGGTLGFATGRWLSRRHQRLTGDRVSSVDFQIQPVASFGEQGVRFSLTF